jgi:hypothetical protein
MGNSNGTPMCTQVIWNACRTMEHKAGTSDDMCMYLGTHTLQVEPLSQIILFGSPLQGLSGSASDTIRLPLHFLLLGREWQGYNWGYTPDDLLDLTSPPTVTVQGQPGVQYYLHQFTVNQRNGLASEYLVMIPHI